MNQYVYQRKSGAYYDELIYALDRRFGGSLAPVDIDPATARVKCPECSGHGYFGQEACDRCCGEGTVSVQSVAPPEPQPEFDKNGRPANHIVVNAWPEHAQYRAPKKVSGQQVVKVPNYGTVPCKNCGGKVRKRSLKHEYCAKGGCQNESRKSAQEKLLTARRKYRAAHPDCPHPETAIAGVGRRVCTLCGVKFKEAE